MESNNAILKNIFNQFDDYVLRFPKGSKTHLKKVIIKEWKHTTLSLKCCHKVVFARFWDL
jgi:hypothetical protein